jgi:hypothetical protein
MTENSAVRRVEWPADIVNHPLFTFAMQVHTCFYTAYIATAAACTKNSNAATGPYAGVGTSYSYYDSSCGGSAYPLTTVNAQGDLYWSPNPSTTTTVWFLRVCQYTLPTLTLCTQLRMRLKHSLAVCLSIACVE